MRTAIMLVCAAALAAAAEPPTIARWNNLLIVTAAVADEGLPAGVLAQRLTVDFADTPVAEVAEAVRGATGLNVVVAPAVSAAARTVTLRATDMELRHLLRWIGTQAGVHVGWLHGALYFADQPLTGAAETRVYDVSDLTLPLRDFPGPELALSAPGGAGVRIGEPAGGAQPAPTAQEIEDLLRSLLAR